MTRRGVVAVLLCGAASGCLTYRECDPGESHCVISRAVVEAQHCDEDCSDFGCDTRWRTEACHAPGTCVELPGDGATCVLSAAPDARCAGVFSFCDGDDSVLCRGGYPVSRWRCGTDPADAQLPRCIPFDTYTACVPAAATPDPSCPPGRSRYCSTTQDLVECIGDEAVFRSKCGDCSDGPGGGCVGFLGSFCSTDAECASGLACHVDAHGWSICTVPCTVSSGGDDCFQALGTGPFPYTRYAEINPPGSKLLCAAGYCTWQ